MVESRRCCPTDAYRMLRSYLTRSDPRDAKTLVGMDIGLGPVKAKEAAK